MIRFRSAALVALLLGLVSAGCAAVIDEPPTPPPPPPPPPQPAPPANAAEQMVSIDILDEGELRSVEVAVHPATGDHLVAGERLEDVFPATVAAGYAAEAEWFLAGETVTVRWVVDEESLLLGDGEYTKFGPLRHVEAEQLEPAGVHRGVPYFVERGSADPAQVLYVPVQPGVVFQPYVRDGELAVASAPAAADFPRTGHRFQLPGGERVVLHQIARHFSEAGWRTAFEAEDSYFVTEERYDNKHLHPRRYRIVSYLVRAEPPPESASAECTQTFVTWKVASHGINEKTVRETVEDTRYTPLSWRGIRHWLDGREGC